MEGNEMTLNRVTIIGQLGQDPELRYLPTSGQLWLGVGESREPPEMPPVRARRIRNAALRATAVS
jgi:single-stranded DNA-binding protein